MNKPLRLKLLTERKLRLAKLLAMDAPDLMIAHECLLVIRAYAGGERWDSLRFVLADIGLRGMSILVRWGEQIACRLLGRHTWGAVLDEELDETGYVECAYCGCVEREDSERNIRACL